ncbi:hypothetical protein GW17_00036842 [Ensete ventricosum]|nr:hypothetical protein GW17_00036842 [Ensete ventricosum]
MNQRINVQKEFIKSKEGAGEGNDSISGSPFMPEAQDNVHLKPMAASLLGKSQREDEPLAQYVAQSTTETRSMPEAHSSLKLGMTNKNLIPMTSTLIGFTRDVIAPLGVTTLPITIGEESRTKTLMVLFMVDKFPSAYNVIISWPTLNDMRATVMTYHHSMKFPTNAGVGEAKSDPRESRQCYLTVTTIPKEAKKESLIPDPREPNKPKSRPEPTEQVLVVPTNQKHPERTFKVGSAHPEDQCIQLIEFLGQNIDVSRT